MYFKTMAAGIITLAGLTGALQAAPASPPVQAPAKAEVATTSDKSAKPEVLAESGTLPGAPEATQPVTVTVEPGDMLVNIATENQTTYTRIFDANPQIADPNIINPGDVIRIPAADEQLEPRALPVAAAPAPQQTSSAPVSTPQVSRQSAPAPVAAGGGVWDRLAQCESGGNWSINTGNGYYGGLQFNQGTWQSNGGGAYASSAHLASRDQQIAIAERLAAARGFSPWPACAAKLGLL